MNLQVKASTYTLLFFFFLWFLRRQKTEMNKEIVVVACILFSVFFLKKKYALGALGRRIFSKEQAFYGLWFLGSSSKKCTTWCMPVGQYSPS